MAANNNMCGIMIAYKSKVDEHILLKYIWKG
jgi:hypothetical protein